MRGRIWQKLAVIYVAFTIPLGLTTALLIQEKSIEIDVARKELHGDDYLRVVSRILRDVSSHRTLDRRQISGATDLGGELAGLRARIDAGFVELDAVNLRLGRVLRTRAPDLAATIRVEMTPSNLAAGWDQIKRAQRSLLTSERLHDQLISGIRSLITYVGDTSGLVLDPDLDTYYVMDALLIREPELFDQLGRVSDLIESLPERVNVSLSDRDRLAGAVAILQLHADHLDGNLRTAFAATAGGPASDRLEAGLLPQLTRAVAAVRRLAELAMQQVVQPGSASGQAEALAQVREAATANAELWEELFDQENRLLEARMAADERRRLIAVSGVGLVFVLIIALTAVIARRIARDVGAVAGAAQALAGGDLTRRAEVRARDEIGALAAAFNTMAGRLQAASASAEEKVRARTAELQRNAASLELLRRAAVAANQAASEEEATATILRLVCEFAGVPTGHAYFVREGPDGPRLVSSDIWHGPEPRPVAATGQEAAAGLSGRVLATGEPAWTEDGTTSSMAFPVLVGHEVVAVLEFFDDHGARPPRWAAAGTPDAPLRELLINVGTQLGRVIERSRAQEALEESKEAAESASQTKSAFLASMSHELRTPLNAIIGYSEMIQEDLAALGHPDLVADQAKVRQSGKHLLGLIDDILDLSKIEAGRMDVFLETFDVDDMLEEVAATVRPAVLLNGNELRVDVPPKLGSMRADLPKVRQALLNLLSNAAKFTEEGTITLRAARSTVDGLPWLVFTVADSGIGITEEQLARLFEPFSQADSSTTRRYGGTGLGLFISRHFCRTMGGEISCTSEVGVGSTFEMRLPAGTGETGGTGETETGETGETVGETPGETPGDGGPSVLVVDDDAQTRELLRRLLDAEGLAVTLADSGRTALTGLAARRPSFVLLDLVMPEMDGFEFLGELRHHPDWSTIPVVVLTAKDLTTEDRVRLSGQVKRVLRKGAYSRHELLTEVRARVAASTGPVDGGDEPPRP